MDYLSINRLLKLSFLFVILQLSHALIAQSICYDFEDTCDDSVSGLSAFNEPFFSGCVPDWTSAYGTPQLDGGSAFMGFWQKECVDVIGEGIVLEHIPFTGCADIRFNYQISSGTNIAKYTIQLFAIDGTYPATTVENPADCNDENWEIDDPSGLIPIWEATGEQLQIGQNYAVNITEDDIPVNTQQLWFRIAPLQNAELAYGDHAGILIDDFCYLACDLCEDTADDEEANKDCLRDDALFFLETDVDQGVYTIYPEDFESYEDLLGEHSWRVLTSGSEEGPYQELGFFATEDFPIIIEEGLFYTVIHTVNYACGEFCYLERTCSTTVLCEDCGPICCDTDFNLCNPKGPTGLDCTGDVKEGTILTWDAISGTTTYEVDFVEVTDPFSACFGPGSGLYGPTVDFTVTTNSIPEPANISSCYNFRVRAICNGSAGEWSSWHNVLGFCKLGPDRDGPGFPGGIGLREISNDNTIVYPNPSAAFFNIVITPYDESTQVRVFDFSGREIHKEILDSSENAPLVTRWTPLSTQSKGIYLVLIEQGENRTTRKLIFE